MNDEYNEMVEKLKGYKIIRNHILSIPASQREGGELLRYREENNIPYGLALYYIKNGLNEERAITDYMFYIISEGGELYGK